MVLNPEEVVLFFGADNPASNHYLGGFVDDGLGFRTTEHFIMYKKAMLFHNSSVAQQILRARTAMGAKKLGRQVEPFDETVWYNWASIIMGQAKIKQARQNPIVLQYYVERAGKLFIEVSPYDEIWGIKLAEDHPDVLEPNKWKGLNLCGFTNTQVALHLAGSTRT